MKIVNFGKNFTNLEAFFKNRALKIFFEEFLERFKSLSLDENNPPVEMPNSFVYGLREAHIVLEEN